MLVCVWGAVWTARWVTLVLLACVLLLMLQWRVCPAIVIPLGLPVVVETTSLSLGPLPKAGPGPTHAQLVGAGPSHAGMQGRARSW